LSTKFITPSHAPLVLEPQADKMTLPELLDLLNQENDFFKKNLLNYGALLFRNFPVHNEHDFTAVIEALQTGKFIDYIGGDSPRKIITKGVYTSTETPPSMHLPLHNELSYAKHYPSHIYFYCDTPPMENGETILGDARKIYQAIDKDVRERFIEKKLCYISCYPYKNDWMHRVNKNHKSWIHVFETEDKREVERKCNENEISFQWTSHDWLKISQVRPSVISHPQTQEPVWFNQAHHFDFNPKFLGLWRYLAARVFYCRKHTLLHDVYFADNTKIPRQDLYHILDVLDANTIYFPWQKNDVLVLDNILMMHGRARFTGKRRVLTAMTG
jgi:alpha-ketoglutarate-dependent taurine dioxygenase